MLGLACWVVVSHGVSLPWLILPWNKRQQGCWGNASKLNRLWQDYQAQPSGAARSCTHATRLRLSANKLEPIACLLHQHHPRGAASARQPHQSHQMQDQAGRHDVLIRPVWQGPPIPQQPWPQARQPGNRPVWGCRSFFRNTRGLGCLGSICAAGRRGWAPLLSRG